MSSKQSYNNLTVVTGTYASDMTAYTPNAVQGGSGSMASRPIITRL